MSTKKRGKDQTATAISLSKPLFEAIEEARGRLQMDRSNFIRFCIAKELDELGITISDRKSFSCKKPAPRACKAAEHGKKAAKGRL